MAELSQKQKAELENVVNLLGSIKGQHTELVTVLIPVGQNIFQVADQLAAERSTAENIKSKQTRNAVINAIEMILRELKKYRQTPDNGLALFAGNVSEREGGEDIKIWAFEPPKPMRVRTYRCDKQFVIEPLKEMLEVEDVYGLLVIDRQQATIGALEGKHIRVIRTLTSGVPGKIRAGGQSALRFERVTEGLAKEFFRRVAESMKEIFFDMPKLKGILVGGPMPTKEDFMDEGELVTKLKEKVIAMKDIGYVDEHGLELLVEESEEDIENQELVKEKNILTKFFETLGKNPHKALYGIDKVRIALQRGAVDKILISKKVAETSEAKEFEEMAANISAEFIVISTEHTDGEQFFNLTKGFGAILRFAIE